MSSLLDHHVFQMLVTFYFVRAAINFESSYNDTEKGVNGMAK